MTAISSRLPRRAFCGGLAATAGLLATSRLGSAGAQTYPNRHLSVLIPTGQGGGPERGGESNK